MTDLPFRLALLGAATATGLWGIALLIHAMMPYAAGAPDMPWSGIVLGYVASVGIFGAMGWFLGVAGR